MLLLLSFFVFLGFLVYGNSSRTHRSKWNLVNAAILIVLAFILFEAGLGLILPVTLVSILALMTTRLG